MGLIAAKCPQCGAEISNEDNRDFMFCSFCGSKVMFEKQIVEFQGTVSVDGIASIKAMADRADIFLANREFDRASEYFDKILDINPRFAKAYWGLIMCRIGATSNEEIVGKAVYIRELPEYINAVNFADDDERAVYEAVNEKIIAEIARRHDEEKRIAEEKVEAGKQLEKMKAQDLLLSIGTGAATLLAIISGFVMFGKVSFFSVFLLLSSLVALFFLVKKVVTNEKKEKELRKKLK